MTRQFPARTIREVDELSRLANLLDRMIGIPGTRIGVGLDSLVGLIPGIGDGTMLLAGLWIVYRARKLGAPRRLILRMLWNLALDTVIGTIPVLGDIFDIFNQANRHNVRLLRDSLGIPENK